MQTDDYTVSINGRAVRVHAARVSVVPFNQLWPGYQRPLDQTELAAFASWDMDGPVEVEIVSRRPVERVVMRPVSRGIVPSVDGNRIVFTLDRPAQIAVEINGYHGALHLFANPPEEGVPDPDDPNVIFFGPGEHDAGRIGLQSGQTVYIAENAVVYGVIEARSADNLRILGRGILDGSRFERITRMYDYESAPEPFGTLSLYACNDVEIDGIITRDPNVYNVTLVACRDVRISNVKVVGSWRYNSDGIDLLNSQEVTIERCFVRSFDDSIVLTGWPQFYGLPCGHLPCEDVVVSDCVIWNDWGRALEIGASCSAPEIRDVVFRDCDIIRVAHIALDVQNCGHALVGNIRFQDIRVELDDGLPVPRIQADKADRYDPGANGGHCPDLCVAEIRRSMWTRDKDPGQVRDVVFENIAVTGDGNPASRLAGYDAGHTVEGVTFRNITIDGRPIGDPQSGNVAIGDHVRDVRFEARASE